MKRQLWLKMNRYALGKILFAAGLALTAALTVEKYATYCNNVRETERVNAIPLCERVTKPKSEVEIRYHNGSGKAGEAAGLAGLLISGTGVAFMVKPLRRNKKNE